jgi:hypothetical protein
MALDPNIRATLLSQVGASRMPTVFGSDILSVLNAMDEAERERDKITMAYINDLTYVECETNKKVSRFRARLARPHGRIEVVDFDSEAEAIAAVRKAAGLEN